MGLRLTRILSFVRALRNGANVSDVKVDRAGGDNRIPEHFADPGDDSFPLITDYAVSGDLDGGTRSAVFGYLDPINEPKAEAGEKRIYGRDAATGIAVVDLWLKNDGTAITENANGKTTLAPDGSTTIESPVGTFTVAADGTITGSNASGSFQLQPGGGFVLNSGTGSLELQSGGDFIVNGAKITAAGEVINAAGKVLGTHTHPQGVDSNSDTQQNTGAPL